MAATRGLPRLDVICTTSEPREALDIAKNLFRFSEWLTDVKFLREDDDRYSISIGG